MTALLEYIGVSFLWLWLKTAVSYCSYLSQDMIDQAIQVFTSTSTLYICDYLISRILTRVAAVAR